MVDHDGQVPLAFAVADLVDPDPSQPVEQIDLAHASAATRSRIVPTDRHATRINSATAVFDVFTASHAT